MPKTTLSSSSSVPRVDALSTDVKLKAFVKTVHAEVVKRHDQEKSSTLEEMLQESRALLSSTRLPSKAPRRHFSRPLETGGEAMSISDIIVGRKSSSSSSRDFGQEEKASTRANKARDVPTRSATMRERCSSSPTRTNAPVMSSVRFQLSTKGQTRTASCPVVFLEGTHEPRPAGTTPAYLKSNYAAEDEQDLTFVPYFGDDDDDDDDEDAVVLDLFDTERRQRMSDFGPEYKQRETKRIIEDTLELVEEKVGALQWNAGLKKRVESALSDLLNIDLVRFRDGYSPEQSPTMAPSSPPQKPAAETEYLEAIDSYRQCFCRRCLIYDCSVHGCLAKPNIQLQGELAVEKERSGFWKQDKTAEETTVDSVESSHQVTSASATIALTGKESKKRPFEEAVEHGGMTELSLVQKAICERTFLMHQGDCDKIALTLGAPRQLVVDFVASQGMSLGDFEYLRRRDSPRESKRRKVSEKSMKNYNASWLKRVEDAEIHSSFYPCNHSEPCSEENCSCIDNRVFCTKHCAWGEKSRNFFKGCDCKGGNCRTKSCSCFAAKRECDPDLCTTCGACTDPPNQPATKQRCRNDSIGMRRHCHLLLAESSVKKAGWGLYTKHALMKNDYIHTYVGEVISQEEAERRGRIYDKMNKSFLFNLSSDFVVDATRKGNKTRFINHSSNPNCTIRMTWVNGDIHIGVFALCDIDPQTELFFDYQYGIAIENDLILKPGVTVDWMKDPKTTC